MKRQKQRTRLKRVRALYSLNLIETEFLELDLDSLRVRCEKSSKIYIRESSWVQAINSLMRRQIVDPRLAGTRNNNHDIEAVKADHAELRTKKAARSR